MMNETLNALKAAYETKAQAYVAAYNGHDKKKSELKKLKADVTEALDRYNSELCKETYREWAMAGDAVKTAIMNVFVPGCKRVSFKTDDDDIMSPKYNDAEIPADLVVMHRTIGADKFASAEWFNKAQKFCFIVGKTINERITGNPDFEYDIDDAAKTFEFEVTENAEKDDMYIQMLQQVYDAILFLPDESGNNRLKATISSWEALYNAMTSGNGAETYLCNTGKFTNLILNNMHVVESASATFTFGVKSER